MRSEGRAWLSWAKVAVGVCLVGCGALTFVSPTFAVVAQFGSAGSGAGQIGESSGIAVDQGSGDVYVADIENSRIDGFGPEGQFLLAWGWGVSDEKSELQSCTTECAPGLSGGGTGQFSVPHGVAASAGSIYVADKNNLRVEKFDASGKFLLMFGGHVNKGTEGNVCDAGEECQAGVSGINAGEFEAMSSGAIAVDSTGTVYVADEGRVQEFDSSGKFVGQLTLPSFGIINGLAVDPAGDIYVSTATGVVPGVHKYEANGTELGEPRDPLGVPQAITVGPGGELFVDEGNDVDLEHPHILEYDEAGNEVAAFDAGQEGGSRGIAFGNTIQRIYSLGAGKVRLVPLPEPGPLIVPGSVTAQEVGPTRATVRALIDPEGHETTYRFEYGTTTAYGASVEGPGPLGSGFEVEPAAATLEGLSPRTTYHYRVVATDSESHTTTGPDETFTTLPPILIEAEYSTDIASTSARLHAILNPLGLATTYAFEYGADTAYGNTVPVPAASAGAGTSGVGESILIQGLSPGSVYHYRVVAQNSLGVVKGADRTFTTEGAESSAALPDGRAWQMVSPQDKHGISLEAFSFEGGVIQAAANGDALAYIATGPIDSEPEGSRSAFFTQLVSERSGERWSTKDITTKHEAVAGAQPGNLSEYRLFSSNLSTALLEPAGATPLTANPAEAPERTPYLHLASGQYVPLVNPGNVAPGVKYGGTESSTELEVFQGGVSVAGATPDLSKVILTSTEDLVAGFTVPPNTNALYEWKAGALHPVSFPPGSGIELAPQTELGGTNIVRHAVSADGSRIVFSSGSPVGLFLRDQRLGKTVQLDTPAPGVKVRPGKQFAPVFQDATSDGTEVFFTDPTRLTAASMATLNNPDLYMCSIREVGPNLECDLKDLSETVGEAEEPGAVLGLIGGTGEESDENVYFVANGMLTPDAVNGDCLQVGSESELPPAGLQCNLYVYNTATETIRLIAVLSGRDLPDWAGGEGIAELKHLTVRASPNGRYFTFMSQESLTGYDNRDASSGVPDEEVYLYDAMEGTLSCVSCDPTGARPKGIFESGTFPGPLVDHMTTWKRQWVAGSILSWTPTTSTLALYQSRYLSNQGRLLFDTPEGLVPHDSNGAEDVYEYEPSGLGSCDSARGCVALLSSGTSPQESALLDSSADGEDAFFMTAARLSSADLDQAFDVYDAHVCSSAAPCSGETITAPVPCRSTESCRPAPPAVVVPEAQPTLGTGNLAAPAKPASAKRPSRAQKLAKALRECRKKHHKSRKKRKLCEAKARKRFRAPAAVKKSSRRRTA